MTRKKLLPKQHTGKIRHHAHTSYGALALVLLLTLVPLIAASRSVALAAADPVTVSNDVYAVVAGPVPSTAPSITSVATGSVYSDNRPLPVGGTCPADTLVKVFKNDVFAGAAFCQNGRFSVLTDLFLGSNTLIARAYNASNSMAPESVPVVVRKDMPPANQAAGLQPFFVSSEVQYKGVKVGDTLNWPVVVGGGQAPYAINVAWGDGTTDLISRPSPGSFTIQHVYNKPGDNFKSSYNITINSTDAMGNKSFIHLVTIVGGGEPGVVTSIKQGYDWSMTVRLSWQLLIFAVLFMMAFWLGEKRENQLLLNKK